MIIIFEIQMMWEPYQIITMHLIDNVKRANVCE